MPLGVRDPSRIASILTATVSSLPAMSKATILSAVVFSGALLASGALAACGPPHRDVPAADVPKLTSLSDLMDSQATIADPEMKKAGAASYSDADYAAFAEVSNRIQATSTKAKDFSKGPDFDKLADQLHGKAEALGKAAAAKDQKASSDALAGMKATCKECHSKFK
jgi:cytochrome c556